MLMTWMILATIAFARNTRWSVALRPRLTTLLGVALIVGGFFQPWLRFDFLRYMRWGPGDLLTDLLPEVLQWIGPEPLAKLLSLVERVTSLNGWQVQLVPFYHMPTRLAALAPLPLALLALCWTPWGASLAGGRACKVVGVGMAAASLLLLGALVVAAPGLDALGQPRGLEWSLLAVLLGVRVGSGVWLTVAGLALLVVGGVVEVLDQGPGIPAAAFPEAAW